MRCLMPDRWSGDARQLFVAEDNLHQRINGAAGTPEHHIGAGGDRHSTWVPHRVSNRPPGYQPTPFASLTRGTRDGRE